MATMSMTLAQATHAHDIALSFEARMKAKYAKGARKDGGVYNLTEDQLLEEAIDEAVDQVVYLLTLKQKREAKRETTNSVPLCVHSVPSGI